MDTTGLTPQTDTTVPELIRLWLDPDSNERPFRATARLLREAEHHGVGIVCAVAEAGGRLWHRQRGPKVRADRLLQVTAWRRDLGFPELLTPTADALQAWAQAAADRQLPQDADADAAVRDAHARARRIDPTFGPAVVLSLSAVTAGQLLGPHVPGQDVTTRELLDQLRADPARSRPESSAW
ncbi:hypothetical protein ABT095_14870 [Kitasatospora sp. NPDC002227]|uniref:hypothetical protein n=1 Tax=Kitasatospora sp. NPDC002227 TaxID=3154773 RepID=UPI00332F4566